MPESLPTPNLSSWSAAAARAFAQACAMGLWLPFSAVHPGKENR